METIEHYIIHCDNDISRNIRAMCTTRNIDVTIENAIRDGELLNAIYRLYTRTVKIRDSQHGLHKVLGKGATPTRVPAGSRADRES